MRSLGVRRIVLAVVLGLLVSTGLLVSPVTSATAASAARSCAGQSAGYHQYTLPLNGVTRTYVVYVPTSWKATRAAPVLYILHGSNGEAYGTISGLQLDVQANRDGFIVVAPQALGSPAAWDINHGVDVAGSDAQLLQRLPAQIGTDWCTNSARQYIAGYSSGSMMTHAMACYGGFPYAGYAGAGAQPWGTWCPNQTPFDFVYFHGTADTIVPYNGDSNVPSVPWSAAAMAATDKCEAQPTVTPIGSDVVQYAWNQCASGHRLLYDIVQGGGHIWPGADYVDWLGPQTTTISANQVISTFWGLSH